MGNLIFYDDNARRNDNGNIVVVDNGREYFTIKFERPVSHGVAGSTKVIRSGVRTGDALSYVDKVIANNPYATVRYFNTSTGSYVDNYAKGISVDNTRIKAEFNKQRHFRVARDIEAYSKAKRGIPNKQEAFTANPVESYSLLQIKGDGKLGAYDIYVATTKDGNMQAGACMEHGCTEPLQKGIVCTRFPSLEAMRAHEHRFDSNMIPNDSVPHLY